MFGKNQITLIHKLQQKKYRQEYGLFVVEGKKSICEFLQTEFEVEQIFVSSFFSPLLPKDKTVSVSKTDLRRTSLLKNPDDGIGLFKIPKVSNITEKGLLLALDRINDPGNMGTIIRLCDWFGVSQIVCSSDTVDCYNPKVVQSTMGSLSRVRVHYISLTDFLKNTNLPIIGGVMDGNNVYQTPLPSDAILLMGNEAKGISQIHQKLITTAVTIPRFGVEQRTESLNVATATAILLSEIRRGG